MIFLDTSGLLQYVKWIVFTAIGTVLLSIILISCAPSPAGHHSVRFVVQLRNGTRGQQVYLTGNTSKLSNWNPSGVPLTRESDSVWSTTMEFPQNESIEYKVTAGSWWNEALDSSENTYENVRLTVERDTLVRMQVFDWLNVMADGIPVIGVKRFHPGRPDLKLDDLWRYHAGDDPRWSEMTYGDSGWVVTDPLIEWTEPSQPRWEGIGWFRFHFYADSSLWNTTLALRIEQLGASQIFYNGKLLYSFGEVGASDSSFRPNAMSWWQKIRIEPRRDQLIAVRYSNPDRKRLSGLGYSPGFVITLKEVNSAFRTAASVRENAEVQITFTLIPLILFLVHLSLYGFLRSQRQNLYYAICMLGFAGLTYFSYERELVVDVGNVLLFTKLGGISVTLAVLFGLLTIFQLNYARLPKRTWIYVGMAAVTGFLVMMEYRLNIVTGWNYVFFAFTALEGLASNFRKSQSRTQGDWLLLTGFLMLTGFIVFQVLVDYGYAPQTNWTRQSYAYGMIALAVSMSIYLSYNFARVNRNLQVQLKNVEELSGKAMAEERLRHTAEMERKVIEIESERKSRELGSARELQLSLLPRAIPKVKGMDIAAFMKTAMEVGGDYYDFFVSENGGLTVVLGDATGHGLNAGNMVTATKGLLNLLAGAEKVEDIMTTANRAIKQMNLTKMAMCLSVVRIGGRTAQYSSAGMPPLLVFRMRNRRCEQHVLKAMPLGAVTQFPYAGTSIDLEEGDVLVMASDGLHEIFDEAQETYGIENVMNSLIRHAGRPAAEIVAGLYEDGMAWGGGAPLADDLTIVAIRITS